MNNLAGRKPNDLAYTHLTTTETMPSILESRPPTTAAIKVATVSFCLRKVYEKLQIPSKSEAVAKALREQIG